MIKNDNYIQVAPISSNDEINTISINVFLDTNGVAHISELWYVDIIEATKATEGYRSFPKTMNVTNLVVKENDNLYTILDSWDISGNLASKKNKAGINKSDNKIEIYWGIGEYGIHKYEINYEVTNFLTELNDSQIMVSPILPTGMSKFANVNIKIYSNFKYKDIEIYTWGKDSATSKIQNGYIEIETNGSMNDSEYLTILVKFPLKTFNLENKYEDNFNNILPFVDKKIKYSSKLDENNNIKNNTITEQSNIVKETMYCNKCGTEILKNSAFCSSCGNKIEKDNQVEKSKIQNSKVESNKVTTPNNEKTDWIKIIPGIVAIIIMIVGFWNIYGGNGIDGDYWFSDGSGYIKIQKDINSISTYDKYNNYRGTKKVRFKDNKTFVYSDGVLEYTGTINGKKLTVKCENDKMESYEATRK